MSDVSRVYDLAVCFFLLSGSEPAERYPLVSETRLTWAAQLLTFYSWTLCSCSFCCHINVLVLLSFLTTILDKPFEVTNCSCEITMIRNLCFLVKLSSFEATRGVQIKHQNMFLFFSSRLLK